MFCTYRLLGERLISWNFNSEWKGLCVFVLDLNICVLQKSVGGEQVRKDYDDNARKDWIKFYHITNPYKPI